MKAVETNLLKFLQGTRQFVIPIYQRTYSWSLKECQQLWKDIAHAAKDDAVSGHFVGSIVYIERGLYQVTAVPQLLVIDGQQRLTTLSLLLVALGKALEAAAGDSEITRKKLNNYYLFNDEESSEKRYKLLLTKSDKETLIRILEDRELPEQASHRVIENYRFFEEQIAKSGVALDDLYRGLGKLLIVDISLDRDRDNPQLIFESLNSTGLDLTQADLIRNYVLMGLEPDEQARLYQDHWFPMEQSFGHAEYAALFDRFMRDFLTVKTGRIPNIYEVYEHFKSFVLAEATAGRPIPEVVAEVHHYSKHFVRLAFAREQDQAIREAVRDINTLKVDVAYPFLLEVLEDHHQGHVSRDELLSILRLVESYVFRRAICGIPTNSLNKTFANLAREIQKTSYLESLYAAFLLKDSYRRLPLDEEFRQEFVIKDVYNLRARNYLLSKLENRDRKERVDVGSFTIEHVMPQNSNLSDEWQRDLGPDWKRIQQTYLHTIGNLTLTGYNSELSDHPFLKKQSMPGGFADSPIRMNHALATLPSWNEDEIVKRANVLAEAATRAWPVPIIPPSVLEQYKKAAPSAETGPLYTLADHPKLQGHVLAVFETLRKRILNLDSSVREEIRKNYIAYKAETNFVDIVPQQSRLRLTLNMKFEDVEDSRGICKDVSGLGHWGNGDVEFGLESVEEINYAMILIQQAFDDQSELVPSA
jgi:uncharacterized protein with ParB-like and HNH nuclease domain/predicted transport protein